MGMAAQKWDDHAPPQPSVSTTCMYIHTVWRNNLNIGYVFVIVKIYTYNYNIPLKYVKKPTILTIKLTSYNTLYGYYHTLNAKLEIYIHELTVERKLPMGDTELCSQQHLQWLTASICTYFSWGQQY